MSRSPLQTPHCTTSAQSGKHPQSGWPEEAPKMQDGGIEFSRSPGKRGHPGFPVLVVYQRTFHPASRPVGIEEAREENRNVPFFQTTPEQQCFFAYRQRRWITPKGSIMTGPQCTAHTISPTRRRIEHRMPLDSCRSLSLWRCHVSFVSSSQQLVYFGRDGQTSLPQHRDQPLKPNEEAGHDS